MDCIEGDRTFSISYKELKNEYDRFCAMPDADFIKNALEATHLACIISYLKELPNNLTVSDGGIIHELIHLQTGDLLIDLKELRDLFEQTLKLH